MPALATAPDRPRKPAGVAQMEGLEFAKSGSHLPGQAQGFLAQNGARDTGPGGMSKHRLAEVETYGSTQGK
ncbi:hypothetical protein AAFF_G00020350 [Aldrovandia affinis]|uniref:Uncharacterized protein n=1 Tax=Aldrovandia affinis TaxID=143900 RepID=A0AAD7S5F6_9TELE|nr:hypothetical protein AAFF_G00020350 [Aldrovandia affinis]